MKRDGSDSDDCDDVPVAGLTEDDADATLAASHASTGGASAPSLFEEFYDDWAAFDAAVSAAIAQHHPIRKRSSLTFEVYNRTVSKGRHDRKSVAEFLSKTFKCTHGIKFRSRGKGRRQRHKPRDIGCPFHIYASAVEFGAEYRVKVRTQDQHNHPIGPDAAKNLPGLIDSDYELESDAPAPVSAAAATAVMPTHHASVGHQQQETEQQHHHHHHQAAEMEELDAHIADKHAHEHAAAQEDAQALDQAQAQVLMKAQQHALAHAREMLQMAQEQARAEEAREQAEVQAQQERAQAEAHARAHAEVLLQAQVEAVAHVQAHEQAHPHDDLLVAAPEHENESLLESAIEGSIGPDFPDTPKDPHQQHHHHDDVEHAQREHAGAQAATAAPTKFEPTTTLEAVRQKMAQFAEERDWNQFHTPRNLVLALTGEVGELCELFQWRGDNNSVADWTPEEKEHLGEEMSDVLLYLVRLADRCNVDLSAAVHDKMAKNARKYPAELVKGSSKKYNEYKRQRLDSAGNASSNDANGTSESSSPGVTETVLI